MTKILTKFTMYLYAAIGLLGVIFAVSFYFSFFYTGDLEFYDGGRIDKVYLSEDDQIFFTTDENEVYTLGGYRGNAHYINTRGKRNEMFSETLPIPVLVFKGDCPIREVIPYDFLDSLILTEENVLYNFHNFEITKISDGVKTACHSYSPNNSTYFVDLNGNMYSYQDGESTYIYSGVKSIRTSAFLHYTETFSENLFIIDKENELKEITYDSVNGKYTASETVFFDVKSYEMYFWSNSDSAQHNSVANVLTTDGRLYVKGKYEYEYGYINEEPFDTEGEWILISDNVEDFSGTSDGTLYVTKDNTVGFFGYEFYWDVHESNPTGATTRFSRFVHIASFKNNASNISICNGLDYTISLLYNDEWLFWERYGLSENIENPTVSVKRDPYATD